MRAEPARARYVPVRGNSGTRGREVGDGAGFIRASVSCVFRAWRDEVVACLQYSTLGAATRALGCRRSLCQWSTNFDRVGG